MKAILLCLLIASCSSTQYIEPTKPLEVTTSAQAVESEKVIEEIVPTHEASKPIGEVFPIKGARKVFTVVIKDTNYTAKQKEKLKQVDLLIEHIFNSQEFKDEVIKRKYTSTKLTSAQIYDKLFGGAEALEPALDYEMDLKVEMYYKRFSKVVGYTYPNTLTVWTNSKFHSWYSPCLIASNLVHEYSHKIGFDHYSASDWQSVPYQLNDIIEKLCEKNLTPLK